MPDMRTFSEIPWSGRRPRRRVICDVFTPRGEPFAGDPRYVLRRQVERAKKLGYIVNMGPELEFFLFRRADDGTIEPLPHDQAGYFDFSTDLAHESGTTWSTRSRRSGSASRRPTTRSRRASTRSTSSTPTRSRRPTTR